MSVVGFSCSFNIAPLCSPVWGVAKHYHDLDLSPFDLKMTSENTSASENHCCLYWLFH